MVRQSLWSDGGCSSFSLASRSLDAAAAMACSCAYACLLAAVEASLPSAGSSDYRWVAGSAAAQVPHC